MPPGAGRRSRTSARRRRAGRTAAFVLVLGIGCVSFAVLAATTLLGAAAYVDTLPDIDELNPVDYGQNSSIYANLPDGRELKLATIASERNRQPLPWRKISPRIRSATIAIEDRRFWTHGALDYEGIARAAWRNVASGEIREGASTITQQVVRNLYLPETALVRTWQRKIDEAWLAVQLEERWTKAEILTTYLNTVFYGNNAYGVEAAAQTYFSKHAGQLNLPEAALLAGLPQAPDYFDPFDPARRKEVLRRRNEVLDVMWELRYVKNRGAYDWARSSGLGLQPGTVYRAARAPQFVEYTRLELSRPNALGPQAVRSGGYRVTTTLDMRLQSAALNSVRNVLPTPGGPRAALVAIDPRTGDIRAMYSTLAPGRAKFNIATQARRQPGSTFKTVTLTTAILNGVDPDTTSFTSAPLSVFLPGFGAWDVATYGHNYSGSMSLTRATLASDNTVFARLSLAIQEAFGAGEQVRVAHRMGINSKLDAVPSITLGAEEVTPLELTALYATLAAGGVYHRPRAVRKVLNAEGVPVEGFGPRSRRAIPDWAATEVTQILEQNAFNGTGTRAVTTDRRPQAGKTGTAEDYGNAWYCGYTPDLAACVWIGYAEGNVPLRNIEGVGAVAGGTLPAQIWHEFMDVALRNVPPTAWSPPRTAPEFAPFASRWASYGAPAPAAPVTPDPAETEPEETVPVETAPEPTVPAETVPAETAPVETAPVETVPADVPVDPAEPPPASTVIE